MGEQEEIPQFPAYPVPNQGVPLLSHPKQQAPLMKMMKSLIKPKVKMRTRVPKTNKWKKRLSYY